MEKYAYNNEIKWHKNILCFSFLLRKTAWAQNFILDQFVDTSLKHTKQTYNFKQKNHRRQNCVNNSPLLILQSINEQQLSIVDI